MYLPKGHNAHMQDMIEINSVGGRNIKIMLSRECNPTLDQFLDMIDSFGIWSGA
jgi:hypothetical protein